MIFQGDFDVHMEAILLSNGSAEWHSVPLSGIGNLRGDPHLPDLYTISASGRLPVGDTAD